MDVNTIEAGDYELLADQWDQTVSGKGEDWDFVRHYKGETVTLTRQEAIRLVQGGAVAKAGALEAARFAAIQAQYNAALAALPDALREQVAVDTEKLAAATGGVTPEDQRSPSDPDATGFPNTGERPRVASRTVGEGQGGPDPQQASPPVKPKGPAKAPQQESPVPPPDTQGAGTSEQQPKGSGNRGA